jgi:hypothetical protein
MMSSFARRSIWSTTTLPASLPILRHCRRTKTAAPFRCDDTVAKALFNGDASTHGAQLYVDRCRLSPHRRQGLWTGVPAACRQSLLQTTDATSAINIVLSGSTVPATRTAPSAFTMAPYAWLLTDQDIADVVSFIQTSWGNRGAVATSSNVTALRQSARE